MSDLRAYVVDVATHLGVEPYAAWAEEGSPSTAYVALADRSPRYPDRLLMLQWFSDMGWSLALEPRGAEPPVILAEWPDPVRPSATWLVEQVRLAIAPGAVLPRAS